MTEENKTYRLGELIELCDERNTAGKYTLADVKGISTEKTFIDTKANMDGVPLNSYKIIKPDEFAYVADTSRRGDKIALAYNDEEKNVLVSSIYTVFRVSRPNEIDSDYLFMFFNRPEFDRYARFNSWGSARETFSWEDFCDTPITLPPLAAQKNAVAVYRALKENLAAYEHGLQDLKLVCDGFIDRIKNGSPEIKDVAHFCLGDLVEEVDEQNTAGKYTLSDVKGISTEKKFIETKADMNGVSLQSYKIVKSDEFAYVADTSRRGDKIALAYNDGGNSLLISSIYTTFRVSRPDVILSEYLSLFFNRAEFDRYARYCSWGSARETFDWNEMCDVQIPVPPLDVQQNIVNIYKCYIERQRIAAALKAQIKAACPVLVKGSLEWE
ncbi:restriction endonuclease subunit S [Fibrobacter intestinalis]|uniref:Type I restriction enzyme, S subunit n=1 Tax=Fibrobacter intestinalis TaxID=28122 RepID=A0A1T4L924_9BACT|nr:MULTISPECIES: restriction endonuclease subunit S [Fibrobacter]PBC73980.1 type I restriction enzyme S subunit [Fibrobacter sp. NR9]SJZ51061.1 type I restriction enzyme, S subunit [Fibrobacter intestinalis]